MTKFEKKRRIEAKKRGNRLGFLFFEVFLRLFGVKGAYLCLHFPCSYYLFFDREAVQSALAYIRRRFPDYGWLRQRFSVYRLFLSQGRVLIDRHCMVHRPDLFQTAFHGYQQIKEMVEQSDQGFILLMSHTGNWQAILPAIEHLRRPVCLLMRPEDNPAVVEALRLNYGEENIKIVSPEQFLGGVVELMQLIQQGCLVSMMGDRCYDFNSIDVDYLGDRAAFPYGAFAIAAAAACPVLTLMSSRRDTYHYDIEVGSCFTPQYENRRDKNKSLRKWTQDYAAQLEIYVMKHPYQCFLFHDVWSRTPSKHATPLNKAPAPPQSRE
jgi:predicted LPLAT superfamily acyltransferase